MKSISIVFESVLYWLSKNLLIAYSFLAYKINLVLEEEIPSGPKIFAINHPTTSDPFISIVYLKNKVSILVGGELFNIPVFGFILKHTNQIPVNPGKGMEAFLKAKSLLIKGKSVVIFTEGRISPADKSIVKPKTGTVRLALETKAPIIPIGIGVNSKKIKIIPTKISNKHDLAYWYLNGPYAVSIGKAIHLKGNSEDRKKVCLLSKMILGEVFSLAEKSEFRLQLENRKLYQADFNNFFNIQKGFIRVFNQIILAVGIFHH